MRRIAIALIVAVIIVGVAWGAAPPRSDAGADTPVAGSPQAGPQPGSQICDQEEIMRGLGLIEDGTGKITEDPPDDNGIVAPAHDPSRRLYVVEITLPPETCEPFHVKLGGVVLFVQEGTIEYAAYSAQTEATPVVEARKPGEEVQTVALNPVEVVALGPGGWVTQDRDVWFSYRNPGPGNAVVAMAADVGSGDIGDCGGGCRKR